MIDFAAVERVEQQMQERRLPLKPAPQITKVNDQKSVLSINNYGTKLNKYMPNDGIPRFV